MLKMIKRWFSKDERIEREIELKKSAIANFNLDIFWRGKHNENVVDEDMRTFEVKVYEDENGKREVFFNGMDAKEAPTIVVEKLNRKINMKEALYAINNTLTGAYRTPEAVLKMKKTIMSARVTREAVEHYLKNHGKYLECDDLELYILYNPKRILDRLVSARFITWTKIVLDSEVKLMVKVDDFYTSLENSEISVRYI